MKTETTFFESTVDELLARRLYLVVCYRENESAPFSFLILTGAEIVQNSLDRPNYKYYLLPLLQKDLQAVQRQLNAF